MTKHQVITLVERRRRWSREEKERLVAATLEPGASVSEIAHLAGIHVSQLCRWRKELCQISAPSVPQLVPVEVVEALPAPATPAEPPPVPQYVRFTWGSKWQALMIATLALSGTSKAGAPPKNSSARIWHSIQSGSVSLQRACAYERLDAPRTATNRCACRVLPDSRSTTTVTVSPA